MATRFRLAAFGHTMEVGRVVEWKVSEGDEIKEGDEILSVETDKAVVDVESPLGGVILKIVGQADQELPVGATLAWIGDAGEEVPDEPEEPVAAAPADSPPKERVTPVARRLADRNGIDADALEGTGPGGRVTKEDVQNAIESGTAPKKEDEVPEGVEVIPLAGIRKVAAERLSANWAQAPQVTEGIEVDFSACLAARQDKRDSWKKEFGVEPTINDIILLATARALKDNPALNVALVDSAIHQFAHINLNVAVDTEEGLTVPVVKGAGDAGLGDIAKAVAELAEKARNRRLSPDDLEGGTFTVTNLGGMGVDWFTPVLNPPQAAILGVGRVRRAPVVEGDDVVVRDRVTFVLSFDHRVVDGAPCARFLSRLKELIEDPSSWL